MAEERNYLDLEAGRLPYSVEAEQSVLGAIIIDPESLTLIEGQLKPEYFYLPQHRKIFTELENMFQLSRTIDYVTLLERLKDSGTYDEAGGKAYISQLAQMVPSAANILTYAA
ncbi:MAG: replicative DNA helicase, partial [Clostridia bacterium]|nr:replicative DNA helicase [Clostridia bacterium]